MKYSFVIPLYNEAESLEELYKRLTEVVLSLKERYEIIFVDDGSTDSSFKILERIHKNDSRVSVIQFRQNTGKSAALEEGFSLSKGEIVVTLDADLQDDPGEIKKLTEKLNEGYDLVSSWKKKRQDPLSKTLPSFLFNFMVRTFSGVPLHDFNSGLKVYRREAISGLHLYGELHRFIPVLVANIGFKVTEVPVVHHARKFGVSKYGWLRIPRGFFDFLTILFLTKFGTRPLHFFGGIGSFLTLMGGILGAYLTILRLTGETIGRRPLLFLTMLLVVSGLQFIFTGLLAEMILHLSPSKKFPVKKILKGNEK